MNYGGLDPLGEVRRQP